MSRNRQKLQAITTPVTITSLSHDGRGVAQLNGKTTFIEGALPGEQVLFTRTKQHSNYDEGIVSEVQVAAAERAVPLCIHYEICGGCSTQHIKPEAQIAFKQQMLLEQLKHFGGVVPEYILSPLVGPGWGYRRKARLGVKYVAKKQKVLVGFREKNGRYLADLRRCETLHPHIGTNLENLQQMLSQLQSYEVIPQIEVSIGDELIALIIRHLAPLSAEDLTVITEYAKHHNLQIFLQPGNAETIHPLWPSNPQPLSYSLPDQNVELQFQTSDFTQVNGEINRLMVSKVLELLAPKPTDNVLDLFCGLGNFTLPLARLSHRVTGVEGSDAMVVRGQANAQHNNIANTQFYAADLDKPWRDAVWAQQKYDKILLDPPRSGALAIVEQIAVLGASRIVYVSCNPATLARDAKVLAEQGYRLQQAGVIDMFPQTRHVESLAVFEKHK